MSTDEFLIMPNPKDPRLTERVAGVDQDGKRMETSGTVERPLTLFLNGQEIVTMMSICDYPEYMAIGYLVNQNMLLPGDEITGIDYEEDISTIVVRTAGKTDFEEKLKKKTMTSGCAQGTVFGDVMEKFETVSLPTDTPIKTSWLYSLMKKINPLPSLYLEAGAIHGCVLAKEDKVLLYMEDVGRHNAIDKIAGYMFQHGIDGGDKIFYTTGRLTSEMVIKAVQMGIPILASRSGFTAWGVELARQVGLTLIGRARGRRFVVLSGEGRIVYDAIKADRLAVAGKGLDLLRAAGKPGREAGIGSSHRVPPAGHGGGGLRTGAAKRNPPTFSGFVNLYERFSRSYCARGRQGRENWGIRAMRLLSMTTLPASGKLTVTRPSMLDCTCPTPQSGWAGWVTRMPGSRIAFMSSIGVLSCGEEGGGHA